jgi:hypothetical protein
MRRVLFVGHRVQREHSWFEPDGRIDLFLDRSFVGLDL